MDRKKRKKAIFRNLMNGSGLTLAEATDILGVPYGTLAAWRRPDADKETTTGPTDEALKHLQEIVITQAKSILEDGWKEESRDPLPEAEFKGKIARPLDFEISQEEELGRIRDEFDCDIVGRTGLLGRIHIGLGSNSLAESKERILEEAWQHYRRMTNRTMELRSEAEEKQHLKGHFAFLKSRLGLTAKEIAAETGRAVSSVNSWLDPKKANVPPRRLVMEMQKTLQKWASDLLLAIEADKVLLEHGHFDPSLAKHGVRFDLDPETRGRKRKNATVEETLSV